MPSYPNRCQHLKINGTQCGSPALRRNRFCFFHKRFQDERIRLAADRKRSPGTFILPVLEDANSIQIALMQVMRLLVAQQIEHKTASLLLYALQTASANLRMTNFQPSHHDVILNPSDAADTLIGERAWHDEDFEADEDEDDGEDEAELDPAAALYKKMREERIERARKRAEDEENLKIWAEKRRDVKLVRDENGILKPEYIRESETNASPQQPSPAPPRLAAPAKATQPAPKKPVVAADSEAALQADIEAIARKHFFPNMPPEVAKVLDKRAK